MIKQRSAFRPVTSGDIDPALVVLLLTLVNRLTRDGANHAGQSLSIAESIGSVGPPPGGVRLSARQVDVVRLVAQGLTNAQVADTLCISPRTVERHLDMIYNKLGLSSRNALTRYALIRGIE